MKGFDRPLKPSWIYHFVKTVDIGDKISDHKEELYDILWELDGEEGKRKVKTVLSRYYLKSEENPKSQTVERTLIFEICNKYPLRKIKSLLLFQLLMRSLMIRELTKMIHDIYGSYREINYQFLRKKVIQRFGERDISTRSLRNLLYTLENFDILKKVDSNMYSWKKPLNVDELNACYMLKLFSDEYKKSPHIRLSELKDYLFIYFKKPDFDKIVKKYNGVLWEYSVRVKEKVILFDETYQWNETTLQRAFDDS